MAQYIDKDAVVAEIERRKQTWQHQDQQYVASGRDVCDYLLGFLDTLGVKEVDLEKEIELVKGDYEHVDVAWNNDFDYIAKHFFELGLNAQRKIINVPNIDDSLEELGVDPTSKEAKIFKESYYIALEKLKAQKGE